MLLMQMDTKEQLTKTRKCQHNQFPLDRKAMRPYIKQWEGILKRFLKPLLKQNPILLEGIWPSSNWKVNYVQFSFSTPPILEDQEDLVIHLYCGFKNMKPSLSLTYDTSCKDLQRGNFIFACPSNFEMYFIWMGKVHNNVVKDGNDEHYNFILIFCQEKYNHEQHHNNQ